MDATCRKKGGEDCERDFHYSADKDGGQHLIALYKRQTTGSRHYAIHMKRKCRAGSSHAHCAALVNTPFGLEREQHGIKKLAIAVTIGHRSALPARLVFGGFC